MPISRPDPNWRTLSPERTAAIRRALDRFTSETRVPAKRLAAAMGMDPSDLSPSHLGKRGMLLFWSLRREALSQLAVELGLDLAAYRSLQQLSTAVVEVLSGFAVPPETWHGGRAEAIDAGEVGVQLFDRHDWEAASEHLTHAWSVLSAAPPDPEASEYRIAVRAGTQLVHLLTYQGRKREAVRVAHALLKLAGQYRRSERPVLNALALAYRAVGVAAHHQGLDAPASVVRLCRKGHGILVESRLDPLGQVAALRDQAKPYLLWGLGRSGREPQPDRCDDALSVLDQSEALAGGEEPEEPAREEWLLTRLTRVQCLGVMGRADAAQRCWDDLRERTWAASWLGQTGSPLGSKAALTGLALELAIGDLDSVAVSARSFRENSAYSSYGDRLRRVQQIEEAVGAGNLDAIRHAILA